MKSSCLDCEEDDELIESIGLSSQGSLDLSHPSVDGYAVTPQLCLWPEKYVAQCAVAPSHHVQQMTPATAVVLQETRWLRAACMLWKHRLLHLFTSENKA